MSSRVLSSVFLAALTFLAPMAARPESFAQPEPWIGFAVALTILLSQPSPSRSELLSRSSADRRSALGIFVGMIVPQAAAALDFAFRAQSGSAHLVIGTTMAVVGLGLRLWAIRTLGRYFTPTVRVVSGQPVVTSGPYGLLRHPSYTGALMAAFGTTIVLGSGLGAALLALFAVPAYLHRMATEEAALATALGGTYRDYMRRSWRVLPLVY